MIIENSKYLEIPIDSTIIWRYMDLPKYVSLLSEKSLWFSRVDLLRDWYEGRVPFNHVLSMPKKYLERDPSMLPEEASIRTVKDIENIDSFRKYTLVNSWSISKIESFALWKIYLGRSSQGIAIESRVGSIRNCFTSDKLKKAKIGKIDYSNSIKEINQDIICGTKKPYYSYENEFRIFVQNQFIEDQSSHKERQPKFQDGTNIEIDPKVLIHNVVVSPYCENWFFNLVKKLTYEIMKYDKMDIPIKKSRIREKL